MQISATLVPTYLQHGINHHGGTYTEANDSQTFHAAYRLTYSNPLGYKLRRNFVEHDVWNRNQE